MTNYPEAVYDVLVASDDLLDVLTGGVILYRDQPIEAIDPENTPDFFDSDSLLLPLASIKGRAAIPDNQMGVRTYASLDQVVEIWLYADRDAGWSDLDSAAQIIFGLLHDQQVEDSFNVMWVNELEGRDSTLGNKCFLKLDYQVKGWKQPA